MIASLKTPGNASAIFENKTTVQNDLLANANRKTSLIATMEYDNDGWDIKINMVDCGL